MFWIEQKRTAFARGDRYEIFVTLPNDRLTKVRLYNHTIISKFFSFFQLTPSMRTAL